MFETAMLFGGRVSMLPEASGKEFPPTRRWSEGTKAPSGEWVFSIDFSSA
jgi:hypothetical protein